MDKYLFAWFIAIVIFCFLKHNLWGIRHLWRERIISKEIWPKPRTLVTRWNILCSCAILWGDQGRGGQWQEVLENSFSGTGLRKQIPDQHQKNCSSGCPSSFFAPDAFNSATSEFHPQVLVTPGSSLFTVVWRTIRSPFSVLYIIQITSLAHIIFFPFSSPSLLFHWAKVIGENLTDHI